MKKLLAVLVFLSLASIVSAQRIDELNGKHTQLYPTKDKADKDVGEGKAKPGGGGSNLTYHGGPVIHTANVVSIFWGPSWADSKGNLNSVASELLGFFSNFGTTPEYNVITQYSAIQQHNLTNTFWWDSSAPPTNVPDSAIQAEVVKYFTSGGGTVDVNTIYEVFLPSGSYSSYGNQDSCGGPNLVYCAYHSNFSYNHSGNIVDLKYASMPYPSCFGCQWTGWTDAQNFEHFACHETREAVTDPDGTAWYDRKGNEADDKCAWSPAPFFGTGGYGYQYEWSNLTSSCVKSR